MDVALILHTLIRMFNAQSGITNPDEGEVNVLCFLVRHPPGQGRGGARFFDVRGYGLITFSILSIQQRKSGIKAVPRTFLPHRICVCASALIRSNASDEQPQSCPHTRCLARIRFRT